MDTVYITKQRTIFWGIKRRFSLCTSKDNKEDILTCRKTEDLFCLVTRTYYSLFNLQTYVEPTAIFSRNVVWKKK